MAIDNTNKTTVSAPAPRSTAKSHGTNGNGPTTPKLRDSCDACSSSKVKCDKTKPSCARCIKRGLTCEYLVTRRAGRTRQTVRPNPNSYVKSTVTSAPSSMRDWPSTSSTAGVTKITKTPTSFSNHLVNSNLTSDNHQNLLLDLLSPLDDASSLGPPSEDFNDIFKSPIDVADVTGAADLCTAHLPNHLVSKLPNNSKMVPDMTTIVSAPGSGDRSLTNQNTMQNANLSIKADSNCCPADILAQGPQSASINFEMDTDMDMNMDMDMDMDSAFDFFPDLSTTQCSSPNTRTTNGLAPLSSSSSNSSINTTNSITTPDMIDFIAYSPEPSCFCLTKQLSLLRQLFPNSASVRQRSRPSNGNGENGNGDSTTNGVSTHKISRIQAVIADNRQTINAIQTMLQCPCSSDGYSLAIMSLIVFKVLGWYAAAVRDSLVLTNEQRNFHARVSPPLTSSSSPSHSITTGIRRSPSASSDQLLHVTLPQQYITADVDDVDTAGDGRNAERIGMRASSHIGLNGAGSGLSLGIMDVDEDEDQGRIAAQLVLGELHKVQLLINQLSRRLKGQSRDSLQLIDDLYGGTNDTSSYHVSLPFAAGEIGAEAGWPFSATMLDTLEHDLRKRLRGLSQGIVDMLRKG